MQRHARCDARNTFCLNADTTRLSVTGHRINALTKLCSRADGVFSIPSFHSDGRRAKDHTFQRDDSIFPATRFKWHFLRELVRCMGHATTVVLRVSNPSLFFFDLDRGRRTSSSEKTRPANATFIDFIRRTRVGKAATIEEPGNRRRTQHRSTWKGGEAGRNE